MVNWTELIFFDQGISGSPELVPVSGKTTGSTSRKTRNPLCWSIRKVSTHHLWKCWRTRQGSYFLMSMICLWYVFLSQLVQFGGHMVATSTSINFLVACAFPRASSPYAGPSAATWSPGLSQLYADCHQLQSSGNKVILERQWKNITLW